MRHHFRVPEYRDDRDFMSARAKVLDKAIEVFGDDFNFVQEIFDIFMTRVIKDFNYDRVAYLQRQAYCGGYIREDHTGRFKIRADKNGIVWVEIEE